MSNSWANLTGQEEQHLSEVLLHEEQGWWLRLVKDTQRQITYILYHFGSFWNNLNVRSIKTILHICKRLLLLFLLLCDVIKGLILFEECIDKVLV